LKSFHGNNVYKFNDSYIESAKSHKHLGVVIDYKLNFDENCDYLVTKSLKKWATLKIFCNKANGHTFLKLYLTYILPNLEYCNSIWQLNDTQIKRIESVQRKCSNFICHKLHYNYIDYSQRLTVLGLKSLENWRKIRILNKMYSLSKNKNFLPNFLNDFYDLECKRNGLLAHVPKTRIQFCDKNFFMYSIKLFNSLPLIIRNCQKFSSFSKHVNQCFD